MRTLLIVGLGGATGSMLRWLVSYWTERAVGTAFPWGTFFVNFVGCFLIGLVIQLTDRSGVSAEWRMFLATGFCGGFTTFSAFALENLKMIESGNFQGFLMYTLISVVAGVAGVMAGVKL